MDFNPATRSAAAFIAATCLMSHCPVMNAQPTVPSAESMSTAFAEQTEALMARYSAADEHHKEAILKELYALGRRIAAQGAYGASDALRFVGHKSYRQGDLTASRRAFQIVAAKPDSAEDAVDSLRMLGQIDRGRGAHRAARDSYEALMAIARQSGDMQHLYPQFVTASLAVANLRSQEGDYEGAIATRMHVLNTPEVRISREERFQLYLTQARDSVRAGDTVGGVGWYDSILRDYPEYGTQDGSIVDLLYERIEAHGFGHRSPERIALLRGLWEDPRHAHHWQTLAVGHNLAELLRHGGNYAVESALVLDQLQQRIDARWPAATPAERRKYEHLRAHTLLARAAINESNGNPGAAIALYAQLLHDHSDHDYSQIAIAQVHKLLLNPRMGRVPGAP